MKQFLFLLLFVVIQGCASLGDQGAFTETPYVMPDGTKHTFVERTKINIWVPSTHMIKKYIEVCEEAVPPMKAKCKTVEYDKPHLLAQDGPGTEIATELIRAGSLIGSTVYAADKALDAANAIGDGLSRSGSTTEVSNNTNVEGTSSSGSYSNSKAGAISISKAQSKSKAYQRQGQGQYQGQHQKQKYSPIKIIKRSPRMEWGGNNGR